MTETGLVNYVRKNNRFAIEDKVAGYFRYLERWELKRLIAQGVQLDYIAELCEGDIPGAPPRG